MSLWSSISGPRPLFTGFGLFLLVLGMLSLMLVVQNRQRSVAEVTLHERLKFEELLPEIATEFVSLPAVEIDGKIQDTQHRGACPPRGATASSLLPPRSRCWISPPWVSRGVTSWTSTCQA